MMVKELPHRTYWATVFQCRCPRCREAKLFVYPSTFRFKRNMVMHGHCPLCRQPTDLEVGFYYGTGYVSYVLGLLFTVLSFLLWFLIIGFSFSDHRFVFWISFNSLCLLLMQPWLMRFSRVLWLSWFVKYDPLWQLNDPEEPERVNEEQKNNW